LSDHKRSALKYLAVFFAGTILILLQLRAARRLPAGDSRQTIKVGNTTREYILQVPAGLESSNKIPLILVFHGGGGRASSMPRFSGFDILAQDPHNLFIAAYPEALNKSWNDSRRLSPADDVEFIRGLIEKLQNDLPVDPHRVYATGISNGGFFSSRLACDLSDKIAAIASVAATMPTTLSGNCHPARPISVLYLNGTKDPLVPVNGGPVGANLGLHRGECISLADAVNFWTKWDQTATMAQISRIPDKTEDGTHVTKEVYAAGRDGTEVVVYRIEGGGHTWPGGSQYLPKMIVGKVTHQIDGAQEIWGFFRSHRLP